MTERSELIAWIRGEIVGPSCLNQNATIIDFNNREFVDAVPQRRGALGWRPIPGSEIQEVLYYDRETPHRKYGTGLLHPTGLQPAGQGPDQIAAQATDHLGIDSIEDVHDAGVNNEAEGQVDDDPDLEPSADDDDFDVTSPDIRHPSSIAISLCVRLGAKGRIVVRLPQSRQFSWQSEGSPAFPLNGRYEQCSRSWQNEEGQTNSSIMWRRHPAVAPGTELFIDRDDLVAGKVVHRTVPMPEGSPIQLKTDVFPRAFRQQADTWLVTVVLRNSTPVAGDQNPREAVLYQSYYEVSVEGGELEKYPESRRPFDQLDPDEQSLALLYRESATWGIGHGCSAGWDAGLGETPSMLYVDVMPAVEIPSMTPDIVAQDGNPIQLTMRELASLPDAEQGSVWESIRNLANEYRRWTEEKNDEANNLPDHLKAVALRHLDDCGTCLNRIDEGINLLRTDPLVRKAFKLANLSMLLQQIASKQLSRRPLEWIPHEGRVAPTGYPQSPWIICQNNQEGPNIGSWRAFQIAFLLMSLRGIGDGNSADREVVDLIWFPTGGGKTEAYLGAMAFYMFHQRLLMANDSSEKPRRDGTNVLMRYTLRMLTTQQFQRASNLICAMEFLRRNPESHQLGSIPGQRFSLGLWIGSNGSPNDITQARRAVNEFRGDNSIAGNPLVLTECPWCRTEIGRYDGKRPKHVPEARWKTLRVKGITDVRNEGPLLHCPDGQCVFGAEEPQNWIPVEVIDERIFQRPPSLVIATADKFAMTAYRPASGALFGRSVISGEAIQTHVPPGLIVQDELHLISGPLGTMYGLYEGIFERLCSLQTGEFWIRPKLIASTATIRGAADQIKSLYARTEVQLFPSPGLFMGDSFFGTYARNKNDSLSPGRLYLGIHASEYGSILTTQVRAFSSALFRPFSFNSDRRDPWWSLLVFYNSIRELGGAKTLFDSDIRSRLKFLFNRENYPANDRRNLRIVEELTSRLSQAEIVSMMDRLSTAYSTTTNVIDACLASNIIEVGVDIDRLSLMGVVGQPKTTAQYIQVTGRVGRRWWERPGLILMIYNPAKSRDRSHFEQFHSYHRRLYERVEPTSATPFALSAIQRALPGALIAWARQHEDAPVQDYFAYRNAIQSGSELLQERCEMIQIPEDLKRSLAELDRVKNELERKWGMNPQGWEEYPHSVTGEYLMLWPGQYATQIQKQNGVVVPSSMRQVDASAELAISQGYAITNE